jgi:hypothetical protein
MITTLLRLLPSLYGGHHHQLALENPALPQQLAVGKTPCRHAVAHSVGEGQG